LGIESAIWFKIVQVLILSITALLVFLLVVKPMIRRLTTPTGGPAEGTPSTAIPAPQNAPAIAQSAAAPPNQPAQIGASPSPIPMPRRESMIDVSQIEGQVRESAIRKIGDVVTAHPEEAMAIVRTWLHQPA
jgi:flagellar M-ring protein FliF